MGTRFQGLRKQMTSLTIRATVFVHEEMTVVQTAAGAAV